MNPRGSFFYAIYRDGLLRVFFFILTAKLFFFTYITSLYSIYESQFTKVNLLIFTLLPSFGEILVLLCLSLLIKRPGFKLTYLVSLDLLFSLLFLTHSLHLKYFEDFATIYELRHMHLLFGPAADSVLAIMDKEVLFFADLPFLPLLASRLKNASSPNMLKRANAALFLLLLGLLFAIHPFMINRISPDNCFKSVFNRTTIVRLFGFINYQILDVYTYLTTEIGKAHVAREDVDLVRGWFSKWHDQEQKRNELTGIGNGMNLIVIQVESLQSFVIGRSINGIEITPNLNMLTENSIYYNRIYDQTGFGGSSDATFLANCSLYPSRHGAVSFYYPQNYYDCLPGILRERGYSTATMHAYHKSFWNSEQFERGIGFEHQFYRAEYRMEEHLGWGLSDRSFLSQSAKKIIALPTPFYAFLRTLATHKPYDYVTANDDNFPLGGLKGKDIGHYLRSMHYVDAAIGEFIKKLSEYNLKSNTVIVVYGDHRARLNNDDLRELGIEDTDKKGEIALIISCPTRKLRDERSTIGGLIDVAPTVLNILGVDTSEMFFMGRDLGYNYQEGYVIFRDGSFIGNPEEPATEYLMISDRIIEKDIIPALRRIPGIPHSSFIAN